MARQFEDRRDTSELATELLIDHFWNRDEIRDAHQVQHIPHGYELCLPPDQAEAIRLSYDPEALRIKHRPDYIARRPTIVDLFLEYKVSRTPRFTERTRQWDIVPIEEASWDECVRLMQEGNSVALLVFCPYHSRPLTCELVGPEILYRGGQTPGPTMRGTGIRFINVDLSKFRPLPQFLQDTLDLPKEVTVPLLNRFLDAVRNEPLLQVDHDERSKSQGQEPKWLPLQP